MIKNVLIIDNIDSFIYNLAQYVGVLGGDPVVVENKFKMADIEEIVDKKKITHIIISPGPKTPKEAGISNRVIKRFGSEIPILGVCLGHQCIGYTFGAKIRRARTIRHGKSSLIEHRGKGILKGVESPIEGGRYHSLVVEEKGLPDCLEIIAKSLDDGEIMGLMHRQYKIYGLQFHPESILTKNGVQIIKNFLEL